MDPHPVSPRETEYEYFMRIARDSARRRRSERRARMIRKLTGRRNADRRAA